MTLAGVEPGRKQVLIVEDWAEIRRLRRSEGVSISEIARVLGCSRNTVKAALASEGPPRYERVPTGSLVDAYEPRIRELLRAFPRMPATVIAERVGWPYSIRTPPPGCCQGCSQGSACCRPPPRRRGSNCVGST